MDTPLHTIVIGAGHAGLATSRALQRHGLSHAVLERDSIGASWRRRWNSFHLNTPSEINILPDAEAPGASGTFLPRDAWISTLESYVTRHGLPVREGVEVTSVRQEGPGYVVETSQGSLHADNVVLCSGDQNAPRVPGIARALPEDIEQLHSDRYRAPSQLPEGAVLVVGSGQTGTQIVEDLLEAGREVFLCTSMVGRPPRRYRGRDITEWMRMAGLADQAPSEVPDDERDARQGMISGTRGGHSISLHLLAHAGAKLLGKLSAVEDRTLHIADDLAANVAKGDEVAAKLQGMVNTVIEEAGLDAPPPQPDPADEPYGRMPEMAAVRSLGLDEANIRSVLWATGYGGDFSYLPAEWLDDRGLPSHAGGVCRPGLYCVGLMWQRRRVSGLIVGAAGDAEQVVDQLRARG